MGASAAQPDAVCVLLADCLAGRRPFVVFSDGEDLTCIFGDQKDTPEDVQREAARCMPWGA